MLDTHQQILTRSLEQWLFGYLACNSAKRELYVDLLPLWVTHYFAMQLKVQLLS